MRKIIALFSLMFIVIFSCMHSNNLYAQTNQMDIKEYVSQTFIHGIPYEEAINYGREDIPVLLEIIKRPEMEDHWTNAIVVLAMIGDERVVDPIIRFITEESDERLSHSHFNAKTSAIISLGYVINRTCSDKALDYLTESLDPNYLE
jgi:hypothetical protein